MGRILAIDYGQKRTGVAVTDEMQIVANPLTTVHTKDVLDFLKDYLSKENVECIVVGDPRQMNYEKSESAAMIKGFVKKIKKVFPQIQVERMDERYTSKMAMDTMIASGISKKKRRDKALVDTISATIILQSYLSSKDFLKTK